MHHAGRELVAGRGRICDWMYAAGGRGAGGFYFFEETRAAEAAAGRGLSGGHGDDMRQFGAPAAAFRLAGHRCVALGAAGFHGEIMARWAAGVQRETIWCAERGRLSCHRGEADAILKCSLPAGESRGAVYFLLLQSLTGNSNS